MASLLVLALALGAGALLRGRLDPAPLITYVLHVALPALAFVAVLRAPAVSAWAVGSVWMVFAVAAGAFALLGARRRWDRATVACLTLCCGLSNTSFVGFPLLEALVGPEALPHAVPLDQLGSFLLACTAAPALAAAATGQRATLGGVVGRLLRFPAIWAMAVALLGQDVAWPEPLLGALDRLAATMSPVALVAVGAQLVRPPAAAVGPLAAGLVYKLAVAPLLVLAWMGGAPDLGARVAVLEAAMAPMVTGALIAQAHGLRPDLAAALLAVGVPLSLVTVWGWSLVV